MSKNAGLSRDDGKPSTTVQSGSSQVSDRSLRWPECDSHLVHRHDDRFVTLLSLNVRPCNHAELLTVSESTKRARAFGIYIR